MNKYREKYIEENGMKAFNNYNVNDYTEFLENELEAITVTRCCKSDSELLFCDCYIKYPRGNGDCRRCGLPAKP